MAIPKKGRKPEAYAADLEIDRLKAWVRSFDGVPEEEAAAPRKSFEDRIKMVRLEAFLAGLELTE